MSRKPGSDGSRGGPGSLQLRLPWMTPARTLARAEPPREVEAGGRIFPIEIVRHRWARRYLVRVTEDGRVRLTVPRGASIAAGVAFVHAETTWIAGEWARIAARTVWLPGTVVLWRGESVPVVDNGSSITCGTEVVARGKRTADIRSTLQRHWRGIAAQELPPRCRELGALHGLMPSHVTVRDQRSRWGACSSRRAITLNWRLMQMPPSVSDYVILHELAHLEHPDHSRRFWRKVNALCPDWRSAERWLRKHGKELL